MTIEVKTEMSFYDLVNMVWSGAKDTIRNIEIYDKEDELMDLLNEVFYDTIPTDTEINDFLWFDDEFIYESLGIMQEEEDE